MLQKHAGHDFQRGFAGHDGALSNLGIKGRMANLSDPKLLGVNKSTER